MKSRKNKVKVNKPKNSAEFLKILRHDIVFRVDALYELLSMLNSLLGRIKLTKQEDKQLRDKISQIMREVNHESFDEFSNELDDKAQRLNKTEKV